MDESSGSTDPDFVSSLPKNDDETERNKRRSNAESIRGKSLLPSTSSSNSPVINNTKNLSKEEILETLNKWHKMYTENKITTKNVWSLHAVEFMQRYIGMQVNAGDMDTLNFASSALDLSSKVYGLRVDSVYDTSMKLSSRINRMYAEGDFSATADSEDDNNGDNSKAGKHETRSSTKGKGKRKSTIADESELLGTFPQIDTSFFYTETHIKNSMVENLFTSRLPLSKSGTTMKLMNAECAFRRESDIDSPVSGPRVNKKFPFPMDLFPKTLPPINPELKNFVIDEWDREQAEISQCSLEDIIFDKDGFPVAALDGSLNNGDDNIDNVYNDSEDDEAQILTDEMAHNKVVKYVVDFQPNDPNRLYVDEYGYMGSVGNENRQLSQIWAGPSHWKLKALKHPVKRFTGKPDDKNEPKRAIRPKRGEEIMVFDENISDVFPEKEYKKKKNKCLSKTPFFMPLLKPEAIHLNRLLTKLGSVITKFEKEEEKEKQKQKEKDDESPGEAASQDNSGHFGYNVDDGLVEYDHINLNNSQYCPQAVIAEQEQQTDNCANFLGNNLVDKPDMVAQSQLPYQTHAKPIDIRQLQNAIWECLSNTDGNVAAAEIMTGPVSFRDLWNQVPPKLAAQTRENLTSQIMFVALLHVCNERGLLLEDIEGTGIVIRPA